MRPRQPRRSNSTARAASRPAPTIIEQVMDLEDSSLLDVLDHVLTKGVMATGDVTLGVAGIDLIYVRLSALLCAADRVLPATAPEKPARKSKAGARAGRSRRSS